MSTTATHSGTIGVHEIQLLGAEALGPGLQVNITFNKTGIPVTNGIPGPALPPCGASLTDVTMAAQVPPELNEGTVTLAIKKKGGGAGYPTPPCNFSNGDYVCASDSGGASGTMAVSANNPMVYTFTATGKTFSALQVGNALYEPGTKRALPIVGASGDKLGVFAFPGVPTGDYGPWVTLMGTGLPVALTAAPDGSSPGVPPDFIENEGTVKVTLADVSGSGAHFSYQSTQDVPAGAAFELSDDTKAMVAGGVNLSTTTELKFGCKTTGDKACTAGNAQGIIVVIDTTDAESFPGGLSDMGTPKKFTGTLTCAAFASTEVAVPAALFGILKQGNPTKMRVSVFRDGFEPLANMSGKPPNRINVVAGHGIVSFKTL